jgi:drug/metabolite transporter (DMT)-like permease
VLLAVAALPFVAAATAPGLGRTNWTGISPLVWLAVLVSSLGAYVFTNLAWFSVVARVGTPRAAIVACLQPFFGALIAVAAFSSGMTSVQWLGGAVIAFGIIVARLQSLGDRRIAL